jgi:hypothetical protein
VQSADTFMDRARRDKIVPRSRPSSGSTRGTFDSSPPWPDHARDHFAQPKNESMNSTTTPSSSAPGSAADTGSSRPSCGPVSTGASSPESSAARSVSAPHCSRSSGSCGCPSNPRLPVSREQLVELLQPAARRCYACRRTLPASFFTSPPRLGERHARTNNRCSACRAQRQRGSPAVQEKRALVAAGKLRPCADCGGEYSGMRYSHTRGERNCDAPNAYRHLPVGRLKLELAKCDVVCPACHRQRVAGTSAGRGRGLT